jgi:hypothetical protein
MARLDLFGCFPDTYVNAARVVSTAAKIYGDHVFVHAA